MAEKKLLDRARDRIRLKHYSIRTEQTYLHWMKEFIIFHNKRHPADMGAPEVEAYLTYLAVERKVAPSTQNVALHAILFLYREVLGVELAGIHALRAKKDKRMPVVLTRAEVRLVLEQIIEPTFRLQAKLLYGTGMRLLECLRLRVKDMDFGQHHIVVRDTKGNEDRVTLLPQQLEEMLQEHLGRVKALHQTDLQAGLRIEGAGWNIATSLTSATTCGPGDILVANNGRVIPPRLYGRKAPMLIHHF